MPFETDEDALDLLKSYGVSEWRNGVIREDRRIFNSETWQAVLYLCDEWDFVFIDHPSDAKQ